MNLKKVYFLNYSGVTIIEMKTDADDHRKALLKYKKTHGWLARGVW